MLQGDKSSYTDKQNGRPGTSKPVTRKKVSARKLPKPAPGPLSTNSPAAAKRAALVGARINIKLCQP